MEPIQTILSNFLCTIVLGIPKWIRMKLFNAEKWVGKDFIIEPRRKNVGELCLITHLTEFS